MRRGSLKQIGCMISVIGALFGLAGCGSVASNPASQEENTVPLTVEEVTLEDNTKKDTSKLEMASEMAEQNTEVEIQNAAAFGNPKEVLDNSVITSNVEVIKSETDELQIDFEIENAGVWTFVASKGKGLNLPDEVFIDDTKIEWTAPTADGGYIFPYMKANETGELFLIDWEYQEYHFAIYGNAPQNTSDRDMAGKLALAIIRNLGERK